MCGICGVYLVRSGMEADRRMVQAMCREIIHRGPDDEGVFVDGALGLGMRRLSIIDVQRGAQPMFSPDRNVAVVFNGEIYNFRDLRRDLEADGCQFRTDCDTEVLVHLYQRHGASFVSRLNGMFALAVWDRTSQRLLLARDRLGQKPLYYAWTSDGLVFGSELKCLLAGPNVRREIDHEAVYHYFTLGYVPHPWTIYRGARQLPPGCTLTVHHGAAAVGRYWELTPPSRPLSDRDAAKEHLRELLTDAVRIRLMSDVPLGAFLSGGVDSSITVALMAQLSSDPIKTFHIDFSQPDYSERAFARSVAERYATEHHELVVEPSAADLLDGVVRCFDEPFGDSSALPTYCVSKMTRDYVTVALAGDGGDESFGGYRRYQRILARRRLPGWLRKLVGAAGSGIACGLPRSAPGARYLRSLGMDHGPFFAVGTAELETRELLSRKFLEPIARTSTFAAVRGPLEAANGSDPLLPFSLLDTYRYLPDDILTKVDRMSMAHSLELRSPFLDYRVVEFASRLPAHWKIRGGDSKVILKETFARDLPPDVLAPRKRGFSVPMRDWLRGELKPLLEEALHDPQIATSGIFRMDRVRSWSREHFAGRRDRSSQLWRYLFFVHWWHHDRDGRGRQPEPGLSTVTA